MDAAAKELDLNYGEAEVAATIGPCMSSYTDRGSNESHRYYLSRRTAMEMLRDRGYNVPISEIDLSLEEFRAIHGDNPDIHHLRVSASLPSYPSNKLPRIMLKDAIARYDGLEKGQVIKVTYSGEITESHVS